LAAASSCAPGLAVDLDAGPADAFSFSPSRSAFDFQAALSRPKKFSTKRDLAVDGLAKPFILRTPLSAGIPEAKCGRSFVLAHFGTANWNSILSRQRKRKRDLSRHEVEFFCVA